MIPSTSLRSKARARLAWRGGCLAAVVVAAVALAACGEKKGPAASQTAAKVNKDEITVHQINFVLQQQRNLRPEQADAASRRVLEQLIDQQIAVQRSDELELDRDPRVVQQLEAVRREVLARAYLEKVSESAVRPTADEIRQYYDANPALFKEQRIYNILELSIEAKPEQLPELREKLGAVRSINEFVDHLKTAGYRYTGNQAVRSAGQLPLNSLASFSKMQDGQAVIVPSASGMQVIVLVGSRSQPVAEEQARPAIEQYLLNERKRKLVEEDLKAQRAAASIEYVGKFATPAASAASAAAGPTPSAAPATSPMDAAAPAASGALSSGDITKGLGLK